MGVGTRLASRTCVYQGDSSLLTQGDLSRLAEEAMSQGRIVSYLAKEVVLVFAQIQLFVSFRSLETLRFIIERTRFDSDSVLT